MKKFLIVIVILLLCEIFLRLTGPNPYKLEAIRSFEEYFQYDSYFGWAGKPHYTMQIPEFSYTVRFDERGFPILPAIEHDTIRNKTKILAMGACYTYGGPMLGPEKGFVNLLAQEFHDTADFDTVGIMGYNLYHSYLLNKKYNDGSFSIVIALFCPGFDFFLDTPYYFHGFGNRLAPHPYLKDNSLVHEPVPYRNSFWGTETGLRERLSLKERVLANWYLVSFLFRKLAQRTSFNTELPKFILTEFKKDVEARNGRPVIVVIQLIVDGRDTKMEKITDDFLSWMRKNNIDYIDLREKLRGHSCIDRGDPFHINYEGQKIIKEEIAAYLKKSGILTMP